MRAWLLLLGGCGDVEASDPLSAQMALLSWCGEELCGWTVEEGTVSRVPTWHEREFGARLGGETTVLSSEWTPPDTNARCLFFELTAQRLMPPELEVVIEVDDQPALPTWYVLPTDYEIRYHAVELTEPPESLRIRVTKHGGDAVMAYFTLVEMLPIDGC
jgi:hypothetical protein